MKKAEAKVVNARKTNLGSLGTPLGHLSVKFVLQYFRNLNTKKSRGSKMKLGCDLMKLECEPCCVNTDNFETHVSIQHTALMDGFCE